MKHGHTLLEMLVVILIIALLAAVAVPQYFNAVESARMVELKVLWGRQKNVAAGKQLTEADLAKWNENLQKANLKHFSAEAFCRTGDNAATPCFELRFTRNARAAAQYQITSVHNLRDLACIPTNILGTRLCKSRGEETLQLDGKTAYLLRT